MEYVLLMFNFNYVIAGKYDCVCLMANDAALYQPKIWLKPWFNKKLGHSYVPILL